MVEDVRVPARQRFPDPRRNWRRSGPLLVAWWVLWSLMLMAGVIHNVLAEPGRYDIRDDRPSTPLTLIDELTVRIYAREDLPAARELLCPNYHGADPRVLYDAVGRYYSGDGIGWFRVGPISQVPGVPGGYRVAIAANGPSNPQPVGFRVIVDSTGSPPCVARIDSVRS